MGSLKWPPWLALFQVARMVVLGCQRQRKCLLASGSFWASLPSQPESRHQLQGSLQSGLNPVTQHLLDARLWAMLGRVWVVGGSGKTSHKYTESSLTEFRNQSWTNNSGSAKRPHASNGCGSDSGYRITGVLGCSHTARQMCLGVPSTYSLSCYLLAIRTLAISGTGSSGRVGEVLLSIYAPPLIPRFCSGV